MSRPAFIPGVQHIVHEALVVLAGAVIAAAVIGQLPPVREWIKRQWDGTPH